MDESEHLLVFTLGDRRYALYLDVVERVVRIPDITPLPKAPDIVLGVANVSGRIIPVVDARKRFRLMEREIRLSDQLIIAKTSARAVALVADAVTGVIRSDGKIVPAGGIVRGLEYVEGVIKLEDGMVLIHDLDKFLSLEEEKILEKAIRKNKKRD